MRSVIFFILLTFHVTGCDKVTRHEKPESIRNFDFSYTDALTTCFSIKFTSGNKVFVKDHFTQLPSEISTVDETNYSFISTSDRARLDSFIHNIPYSLADTLYEKDKTDNIRYQFYFEMDSTKKYVYINSGKTQSACKSLKDWIVDLRNNLKLITTDTALNFESLRDFLPPPEYRPTIQILDPKYD